MTTSIKTCFKCGAEKPLTEFYRHKQMADGHLNKCKSCTKKDVRKNRTDNAEYYRAYDRERGDRPDRVAARLAYQQTDAYRESARRGRRRYWDRNPLKRAAHIELGNAVRDGRVWKSPCCTAPGCYSTDRLHGHHTHYDAPLCVVWICHPCHQQLHKEHRARMRGEAGHG